MKLLEDVAIIGAGLGGCALALALSQRDVPVKIYESRPEHAEEVSASGVLLSPNGLRVLDRLGVFDRITDRCHKSTHRIFKNDKDETTKKVPLGGPEVNGYWNHRIWRSLLLDEMKLMLQERGIKIRYNAKFTGITMDSTDSVSFQINDETCHASLLVGLDGIYSSVRDYISPGITPEYTGLVAVLSHIEWNTVHWPYADYERNATLQENPKAIFFMSEDPRGEVIMVAMQIQWPEQSRKDLEELQKDKDKLADFYRRGYDEHGPTARSIIDSVVAHKETLYIWPYLKMPKLPRWYSDSGRVILCGDGAHALPPSSGQGVNQALEDVYSLTLLLSSGVQSGSETDGDVKQNITLLEALEYWQQMRQDRIDAIFDWTSNTTNVARLPEAERQRLLAEGKIKQGQGDDDSWLYQFDIDETVNAWLRTKQ